MQLSKLELVGFKSFADKTEFCFEPGVTAFVGPNGCGKSNIVDAVKWVLGEQSAKSLRGNEMQDIIFNGAVGQKTKSYAEASLTILNHKKLLAIEFDEVCVTRRLYRSGESEYLLNKQPCRLKDIRELFMDTGVGCDVYSVIEQGQVDRLVAANAKQRRIVFEEAAGISKFKAKREESRRTLDRVKQRLEHVAHEFQWVQKELRSVQIQAGKARSYKEAEAQVRELTIALSLTEHIKRKAQEKELSGRIETLATQQEGAQNAVTCIEAEQAQINADVVTLERKLGAARTNQSETHSRISAAEERARVEQNRIADLEEREAAALETEKTVRARIDDHQDELARRERLRDHFANVIEEKAETHETLAATLDELTKGCAGLEQQIERRKTATIDKVASVSNLSNEISTLSARRASSEHNIARLRQRQEDVSRTLEEALAREDALTREREDLAEHMARLQETFARKEQDLERGEKARTAIEERLRREREEQVKCESRRSALQEIEARAEGIGEGVRAVIAEAAREGAALAGVKGIVADFIKVDLEHALAIETALGDRSQFIVTRTTADATSAIAFLKSTDSGRSGFLPMDRIAPKDGLSPELLSEPGVIGRASDLVRGVEEDRPLFEHLLGDTIVVDNFDTALRVSGNGGARHRILTLAGERMEPAGAIVGGTRPAGDLITRRSELAGLEGQIANLRQSVALLEWERRQRVAALTKAREEMQTLKAQVDECHIERAAKENQLAQWTERREKSAEEHSVNESEIEAIRAEMDESRRREAELRNEIERIEAERAQIENEVGIGQETLRDQREIRADVDAEARDLQTELARLRSDQANRLGRIESIERLIAEHVIRADAAAAEVKLCRRRKAEAKQEIEASKKLAQELTLQQEEIKRQIEQLITAQNEAEERKQAIEAARREAQSQLAEISGKLQELHVHQAQCRTEINALEERAREGYEIDLATLDPQDILPQDFDPDATKEEIHKLHEKIRRLGAVNLAALDDQKTLQERVDFLTAQREDLNKSEQDLYRVIRHLNRECRERFMKTYEAVRENFKVLFRKLFGGGRADIIIEEDTDENSDPLDAGIEIVAQPPGKAPSSISLLSGGERTLTTVALLFAIFKAKPSPFCILDEIDAALDDKNVGRFVELLQEFLGDSQFIVITHNKRTMSVADILYGITMQDSGISKRVAVKFERGEPVAGDPVSTEHLNG
ncbi:MAG: chromosome segregation protein SMC [Planctomycetes bacterium]|nr:chromosome segregation protein SMC [Planctomycetota bacterium]